MKRTFDRMASTAAHHVAQPWFFAACVGMVIIWAPSYFGLGDVNTWQLIINTLTTIVTFLLVALLQNTQERFEERMRREAAASRYMNEEILRHLAIRAGDGEETERLLAAILEGRRMARERS